jgi:hypothetical protein
VLGVLALVGGCMPLDLFKTSDSPDMPVVSVNPFGPPPALQTVNVAASAPAGGNTELALRLDCVGRKVQAANQDTGLDPKFATIGLETPEIFHQRSLAVFVTEGLLKQCKTEGELAALLCLELGKMAAEREAGAAFKARQAEGRAPMEVPIGNAGQLGAMDGVHQVEMARYEQRRPRRAPPPEPQTLARLYLEKAGFAKTELDSVAPLLRTAERNYTVEKQFKGGGPSWSAGELPR